VAFLTSAALLAYKVGAHEELQVFLGHMGGPFWARRDDGAWSIPKGEFDPAHEAPLDVARREFAEEIGRPPPEGDVLDLGQWRQPSGKRIRAFAVAARGEISYLGSNTFEMEWPPRSGRSQSFPEIDRAQWFPISQARQKLVAGQVPILDALHEALVGSNTVQRHRPGPHE
jgi:predicted NUDIX family NTP pyrophosphohydrolase